MKGEAMKKIVVLLLCLSALLPLFGCATEEKARERIGGIREKEAYQMPILTLDSEEIAFDEFRYYYLNYRNMYLEEDPEYFSDEEKEKALKEEIVTLLSDSVAVRLLAEENRVRLTKKDRASVAEDLEKTKSFYETEEAFVKSLEESYMSEDLWVYMMEYSALYLKLFEKLYKDGGKREWSDAEFYDYFSKEYLAVQQIFIPYSEGESAEKHDVTLTKADGIYQRANNGEDFWSLIEAYGKDENMLSYPDGYYFTEGQAEDALYEASAALEVGEISRPVAGETGLYIIKRMELKKLRMDENRRSALFGYSDTYDIWHPGAYDEDFRALFRGRAEKIKIQYGPLWDEISTETVY